MLGKKIDEGWKPKGGPPKRLPPTRWVRMGFNPSAAVAKACCDFLLLWKEYKKALQVIEKLRQE